MATITAKTSIVIYDGLTENGRYKTMPAKFVKKFDGLTYTEEEMSEYFYTKLPDGRNIQDIGITGGHITLTYDEKDNYLVAVSTFQSPKLLTKDEVEAFMQEYIGQMQDGMGQNFMNDLYDEIEPADFEVIYCEDNREFPESTFSQI